MSDVGDFFKHRLLGYRGRCVCVCVYVCVCVCVCMYVCMYVCDVFFVQHLLGYKVCVRVCVCVCDVRCGGLFRAWLQRLMCVDELFNVIRSCDVRCGGLFHALSGCRG